MNKAENIRKSIIEIVAKRIGLNFTLEHWRDLERGLNELCKQLGYKSIEELYQLLINSENDEETNNLLAKYLTIGETYFFRDQMLWEALEKDIFPSLFNLKSINNQKINILVAGCSSGEEAYSIAIVIDRLLKQMDFNGKINIIATDINIKSLEKAKSGIYTEWSFRKSPHWLKNEYFTEESKGLYSLNESIKKRVQFTQINFAAPYLQQKLEEFGEYDIIFCRNVLMYFGNDFIKKVIDIFYNVLKNNGLFVVSPVETSIVFYNVFVSFTENNYQFYKKCNEIDLKQNEQNIAPVKTKLASLPKVTPKINTKRKPLTTDLLRKAPNTISKNQVAKSDRLNSFDEFLALYNKRMFNELEILLHNEIKSNHQNAEAYAFLARIEADKAEYNKAIKYCNKAIEIDKVNPDYTFLCGAIYHEIDDLSMALKFFQTTIFLDNLNPLAYYNISNIYRVMNKPELSEKYLINCQEILAKSEKNKILNIYDTITSDELYNIVNNLILVKNGKY